MVMGLHVKFWHASDAELARLLYRAGHDKSVVDLARGTCRRCKECSAWQRPMTKPLVRAGLAEHFNDRVQTDLFFIFDKTCIILVDECTRYCVIEPLLRKTPDEWLRVIFWSWIRIFGPLGPL